MYQLNKTTFVLYAVLRHHEYDNLDAYGRSMIMKDVVNKFCLFTWGLSATKAQENCFIKMYNFIDGPVSILKYFLDDKERSKKDVANISYLYGYSGFRDKAGIDVVYSKIHEFAEGALKYYTLTEVRTAYNKLIDKSLVDISMHETIIKKELEEKFSKFFNPDINVNGSTINDKEYTIDLVNFIADITEVTDEMLKAYRKGCCDSFISELIDKLKIKDMFEQIPMEYPFNSRKYLEIFHQQNMHTIVGNDYSVGTLLKSSASCEYGLFDIISCNGLGYSCVAINPKRLNLKVNSIHLTLSSNKLEPTEYNSKVDGKYSIELSEEERQEYLDKKEVIVKIEATITLMVAEDKVGIYFTGK